jgi:hypothetical protein
VHILELGCPMEYNLFDGPTAGASEREAMAEGAVLLRGNGLAFEHDLFSALTTVIGRAPFRHMITPGGYTMSVAMTNCGRAGWIRLPLRSVRSGERQAVAGHAHCIPATGKRGRKRCRLPRLRPGRLSDQSILPRGRDLPCTRTRTSGISTTRSCRFRSVFRLSFDSEVQSAPHPRLTIP